jgi:RHH-type rel operon transcriptional repressor/antitoxin RelB
MATSIELDPTIDARLDQLALATGRSKQFFLQELIAHGMDDLEDIYLACLEVERLQRGESSTRSLNAVIPDLELDD